jgi:hypothetical protein
MFPLFLKLFTVIQNGAVLSRQCRQTETILWHKLRELENAARLIFYVKEIGLAADGTRIKHGSDQRFESVSLRGQIFLFQSLQETFEDLPNGCGIVLRDLVQHLTDVELFLRASRLLDLRSQVDWGGLFSIRAQP